jgi:hypothetical protein
MSTSPFFLGAGFDPETIQTLDRAFDQACAALRGLGNAENIQEIIANEIVDRARQGERDPDLLSEHALQVFGIQNALNLFASGVGHPIPKASVGVDSKERNHA